MASLNGSEKAGPLVLGCVRSWSVVRRLERQSASRCSDRLRSSGVARWGIDRQGPRRAQGRRPRGGHRSRRCRPGGAPLRGRGRRRRFTRGSRARSPCRLGRLGGAGGGHRPELAPDSGYLAAGRGGDRHWLGEAGYLGSCTPLAEAVEVRRRSPHGRARAGGIRVVVRHALRRCPLVFGDRRRPSATGPTKKR